MSVVPHAGTPKRRNAPVTGGRAREDASGESFQGRMLGGFRIAHEIGCGGMARVYLAHRVQHAGVLQAAAIKVIHPHFAHDQEFINMFLDEARIVSAINHPNVCRVLDFGQAEGTYYLAMEYVMGESFADVMTRLERLPEARDIALPFIRHSLHQACEALHAAHHSEDGRGNPLEVVHRDVSPQNIMIGYDGCVRVLDFGIAHASERLNVTRTGVIKGRVAYMAPEQMRGAQTDLRADVWSVGVVLWEALSGRRLFKRDNDVQTYMAVMDERIPPAGHPSRAIPASLQAVVKRALQRDPDLRYPTARHLGMDLLRAAPHGPQTGACELSTWMHGLFGDSFVRKRVLLREAAQRASQSSRPPAPPSDEYGEGEGPTHAQGARRVDVAVEQRLEHASSSRPRARAAVASRPVRLPGFPEQRPLAKWFWRGVNSALLASILLFLWSLPAIGLAPSTRARVAAGRSVGAGPASKALEVSSLAQIAEISPYAESPTAVAPAILDVAEQAEADDASRAVPAENTQKPLLGATKPNKRARALAAGLKPRPEHPRVVKRARQPIAVRAPAPTVRAKVVRNKPSAPKGVTSSRDPTIARTLPPNPF